MADEIDQLFKSLVLFILGVALHHDAEFIQQRLTVLVKVSLIVRPMSVEGEPEVRDLQVSAGRDEEIIRLDVAMNPTKTVSFFNAHDHLSQVMPGHVFAERTSAD